MKHKVSNPDAGVIPVLEAMMKTQEKVESLLRGSVANYMHEEIVALIAMAGENNFRHLRYLLEMAALETARLQRRDGGALPQKLSA